MAGSLINPWTNVVSEERNSIVFENRNKMYGAFVIRKEYARTVLIALISTSVAIVLIAITPKILELIKGSTEEKIVAVDITPVDLTAPPPIDETTPPPPPPPPPPVMETVKFTPPVVVDDPVVDDPPPPQETETQVSTVTQEGTGNDDIIIPDNKGTGPVEAVKDEVFTVVEQMPEFQGGPAEMYKFISKNIQYPQIEKENGIQGTVYVTFVVDKSGNIKDVKSLRGVAGGPNLEKEAIRVVKMMPPWKSGKQNGREVSVQFNLPIKFVLK
ncbi:MAG: energy transducer TonB [Bacteroidia bacterium]|nr:energy transducer TonB [Bacteroidia bacterium]